MPNPVLIADDHALFRAGMNELVRGVLGPDTDILQADNYDSALALVQANEDILLAIIDLLMPAPDTEGGIRDFMQKTNGVPVVVVSASDNPQDIRQCIDAGVMGYIPKYENPKVISQALQLVLSGGIYIPPALYNANQQQLAPEAHSALDELTARQQEVLHLLAEGRTNKEIARILDVSEATIKAHLTAILKALQVKNRTQAVTMAQKLGICNTAE